MMEQWNKGMLGCKSEYPDLNTGCYVIKKTGFLRTHNSNIPIFQDSNLPSL